ncbi:hypothetical protein [Deinococcus multiflagellatus]|uniref:Uncharacterized protein n=1 Tax=Deinococcus multiflagellatus TaxID=1656887 RepID=A0ABW1ZJL9_9DEIO|nr:hypothetical protein [Deinococcus multiflagellatus]MBZ9715740.1 hypothetical protein [Deinococcus multiflagellatus]
MQEDAGATTLHSQSVLVSFCAAPSRLFSSSLIVLDRGCIPRYVVLITAEEGGFFLLVPTLLISTLLISSRP